MLFSSFIFPNITSHRDVGNSRCDVMAMTGSEHERRGHEVARYRRRCWPVRLKYETKRSNPTSSRASMSLSSSSKILFESLRLSITPGAAAAAVAERPRRAAFPSVPAAAGARARRPRRRSVWTRGRRRWRATRTWSIVSSCRRSTPTRRRRRVGPSTWVRERAASCGTTRACACGGREPLPSPLPTPEPFVRGPRLSPRSAEPPSRAAATDSTRRSWTSPPNSYPFG